MHSILRDWDCKWYLASFSALDAFPGAHVVHERPNAVLSRLLRDRGNLSVVRGFLSSRFHPGSGIISRQPRALLPELERLLARREIVLWQGPPHRAHAGGRSPESAAVLEKWDFTAVESPEKASDRESGEILEAIPVLRFTCDGEPEAALGFHHGSERPAPLAFAHDSENGPMLGFQYAAENQDGLEHSALVKASS